MPIEHASWRYVAKMEWDGMAGPWRDRGGTVAGTSVRRYGVRLRPGDLDSAIDYVTGL